MVYFRQTCCLFICYIILIYSIKHIIVGKRLFISCRPLLYHQLCNIISKPHSRIVHCTVFIIYAHNICLFACYLITHIHLVIIKIYNKNTGFRLIIIYNLSFIIKLHPVVVSSYNIIIPVQNSPNMLNIL